MAHGMRRLRFTDIDITDPFFDSLKEAYREFEDWFRRKAEEEAYVIENNAALVAFLYLKIEEGPVEDVVPRLPPKRRLKIGTFKIQAHQTRLGERFVKKAFDHAIGENVEEIYITVFPVHLSLINILARYGFEHVGDKCSANGTERVLLRRLHQHTGDLLLDYPLVHAGHSQKYLLSIHPKYHTRLLPDSILNNETIDVVHDVAYTNSIHKVYVCSMDLASLRRGDILVIYRTSDNRGPARFRSVITSVCVVEEVRSREQFSDAKAFVKYCGRRSVFADEELLGWYRRRPRLFVVRFTYNAALQRRITRGTLIDEVGLPEEDYWGFLPLSDGQFRKMIQVGGIDESTIID
ncbi:MAG: hypothetical protein JW741_11265 [Sedimentisphaerales bacterium]|nr:hypothetical protein [Sedimentisphaerales bacterium]